MGSITTLALIIPIIILEFILMITAVIHILRNPIYRFGNRILWLIIVIFVQIIGPILYFLIGRGEKE